MNRSRAYRVGYIVLHFFFTASLQSACLHKVFHHRGMVAEEMNKTKPADKPAQAPLLEVGNIALYFDDTPQVVATTAKHGNKTEQIFFLPGIEIKAKEVLDAIDRINNSNDTAYSISILHKKSPTKGLQIKLAYQEDAIGVSYNNFDSISLQKGIVFRLYNNTLIKKMKDTNKPILELAYHQPARVVIDCGHGGTDSGAVGCRDVKEKNISLQVGLQVAQLLAKEHVTVNLTRDTDQTVSLDERTTFANARQADLFVSIHANAAPNKQSSGIETYCLRQQLFSSDRTDAGHAVPPLLQHHLHKKYSASEQLAQSVHTSILTTIPSSYQVKDRHVKYDVAQVLLGTAMPAILVEIGYLTHDHESLLLAQAQYQAFIAQGIAQGITAYLRRIQSA